MGTVLNRARRIRREFLLIQFNKLFNNSLAYFDYNEKNINILFEKILRNHKIRIFVCNFRRFHKKRVIICRFQPSFRELTWRLVFKGCHGLLSE